MVNSVPKFYRIESMFWILSPEEIQMTVFEISFSQASTLARRRLPYVSQDCCIFSRVSKKRLLQDI